MVRAPLSLAADRNRRSWGRGQRPLHRLHAAGIAAAGHDPEVGARLLQRRRIDVGLSGRLFEVADSLRAMRQLLAEEALRALAAVGCFVIALRLASVLARLLARCPALLLGQLFAGVDGGLAADLRGLREFGRRCVGIGSERGERPLARLGGGMTLVFPLPLSPWPPHKRRKSGHFLTAASCH